MTTDERDPDDKLKFLVPASIIAAIVIVGLMLLSGY